MQIKSDREYMRIALELALRGQGKVNPNPLVGAVIVKNDKILGSGYHERYGGNHAERNAINSAKESLEGACMYVNLEPCCHYGKTPPCTELIIKSGIKKVFVGSRDPNPKVAGRGCRILRENGIEVIENFMQPECDSINRVFFKYIREKRPYIVMKYAMTMDGKIATYSGKSKWITGNKARARVHLDRHRYSAIMVGVNTVIKDNPLLNARIEEIKNIVDISEFENYGIIKSENSYKASQPIRIICDTNLRTPLDSKILKTAKEYKTIIATCSEDISKIKEFEKMGCHLIIQKNSSKINLKKLVETLGKMNIDSIILEGGARLNWSAIDEGIVDTVQSYISGKIFGGLSAKTAISGVGVEEPNNSFRLNIKNINRYDEDILVESEVVACSRE